MNSFDRRRFLTFSGAAAAASLLPSVGLAGTPSAVKPGKMRFVFFTDTHIEPELSGDVGTAKALRQVKALKPEFCIQGGDHCIDLLASPRERSVALLDLYQKAERELGGIPVHHALGNHDVLGVVPASGVLTGDPLYGKKAFEQRFDTKTYYSFDQKGYHFIVLDSVHVLPQGAYEGRIDAEQLKWLASDLAALPAGTPVVVTTHFPLVTSIEQYGPGPAKLSGWMVSNAAEVLPVFDGHNVIAVLQGHTHVNETVYWRNTPYITSGAVCGNWWKGSRWGTPEGFTVVELDGGRLHWRYETYGWASVQPEADPRPSIAHPCASEGGCA